jgi:uncharacterized membrane protein YkvA (DUF1232 family)
MFGLIVPAAVLIAALLFDRQASAPSDEEALAEEKVLEKEFLKSAEEAFNDLCSGSSGGGRPEKMGGINDIVGLETVVAMYYMMLDPKVPWAKKKIIIAALGYFVSPVDAAPGWLDDLGVAYGAYVAVKGSMTEVHRAQARSFIARLERKRRDAMAPAPEPSGGPDEVLPGVEPTEPLQTMAEAAIIRRSKKKGKQSGQVPQGAQHVQQQEAHPIAFIYRDDAVGAFHRVIVQEGQTIDPSDIDEEIQGRMLKQLAEQNPVDFVSTDLFEKVRQVAVKNISEDPHGLSGPAYTYKIELMTTADSGVYFGMEAGDTDEFRASSARRPRGRVATTSRFGEDDNAWYEAASAFYKDPVGTTSELTGTWRWDVGGAPLSVGNLKVRLVAEDGSFYYEPGSKLSQGKWYVVVEDEMGSRRLKKPLVLDAKTSTVNGLGRAPSFRLDYVPRNRAFVWIYEGGEMTPEICVEIDGEIFEPGRSSPREKPNQILITN